MSSCIQLVWVALPFLVKSLGGSDTEVGLCFMGQMALYVVFCILSGLFIDRFKPHKILMFSTAAEILITVGLLLTVMFSGNWGSFLSPITRLIFLMSMAGVVTAFFWPVMMGWISTGHEGAELTKRFGFYNTTWSSANMVLPVIAGYLMEINYIFPIAGAVIMAFLCFAAIASTKYTPHSPAIYQNGAEIPKEELKFDKRPFVWISRIALFSIFISVGLFRSQVGILYKFELGFAESAYGWAVAIMCLSNIVIFYIMGKSRWWHYKKLLFFVSPAIIIVSLAIVVLSGSLAMQLLAAALGGIGYGFVYSSHQYYGVSGGNKRSALMAIHETTLGAGVATGALFGGILSDAFGRYSPYKYAGAFIVMAGIVQIIIWFSMRRKTITAP
jgi:MFS family permease